MAKNTKTLKEQYQISQQKTDKLKARLDKQTEVRTMKIGKSIVKCFPKIIDLFDDPNFNIDEFIKSDNFQRAFFFTFVKPNSNAVPDWVESGILNSAETEIEENANSYFYENSNSSILENPKNDNLQK